MTANLTPAQASRDPEMAWLTRAIKFSIDLAAGRLVRADSRMDDLRDIPSSPVEGTPSGDSSDRRSRCAPSGVT
ncbi:MAG: hypothetical protein PGN29_12750 [Gordonia paraffinivorans]